MSKFFDTASVLALGALCVSAPAFASTSAANGAVDPERDYLPSEIVVTGQREDGYVNTDGSSATKTPTPLIDVPQAINFITEDQLEDQSIRQLGDALRYVAGISMESGEGHRDEVFIRGQETTADFFIDGLRDDAQYYRSLYNIERIEVLKGANALIFGRGAGGGAINRVAKRAKLSDAFFGAEASADTFGAFSVVADVNQPLSDGAALRLSTTYEEFNNDRDFYDGRFIGISPTLTANLSPNTQLIASYTYDDDRRTTDRGVPSLDGGPLTGFDQTFVGDRDFNQAEAQVHIARVRMEHDFNAELSANATVQFADYDKAYANILPRSTDGATVSLSGYEDFTQRTNWIGQGNLIWQTGNDSLESTLLLGFEASKQDTQNGRNTVSFTRPDDPNGLAPNETPLTDTVFVPPFTLNPISRSRDSQLETLSFYVQEQLAIGEHIELVGGIRWDRFDLQTRDILGGIDGDRVDEKFSPRAGIIVKPVTDISVYASYSRSFLPQAGDQFLLLSPTSSQFAPEKFTNYEIGVKWAPMPDVLVTGAIFQLDRSNTRATDPNDPTLTVLSGKSRAKGFEISAVGEITDFWTANIGYTYLDGELRSDSAFGSQGNRLQQLPKHAISAWNRIDVSDRLGFGLGLIHQSSQFSSFSNAVTLPSYWRVDTAIYYTLSDKLSLQVNVENLFDEDYYPSAHGDNNIQPGDPFSVRFGIRVEI